MAGKYKCYATLKCAQHGYDTTLIVRDWLDYVVGWVHVKCPACKSLPTPSASNRSLPSKNKN